MVGLELESDRTLQRELDRVFSPGKAGRGMVSFLCPGRRVYTDRDGFVGDKRIIYDSVGSYRGRSDQDVVYIRPSGGWAVDTREGFLRYMSDYQGLVLSEGVRAYLNALADDEFWGVVKRWSYLGKVPRMREVDGRYMFDLYSEVFRSFPKAYAIYRRSGQSHRLVFSSLLTMVLKSLPGAMPLVSDGYKRLLLKNRRFVPRYRRKVLDYLDSDMQELDFVSFMYELSTEGG